MNRFLLLLWVLSNSPACAEAPEAAATEQPGEMADHAVILTYHHVATDTPTSTSITPTQFDAHLDFIEQHGYVVWPLQRIAETLHRGDLVPENVVGLSFDDAYRSVFTQVHPRLKKRGWPYTVFVTTEAIDAHHQPYMTWEQLNTLAADGVDLGNHSHSHWHMVVRNEGESPRQWRQRMVDDIDRAQQRIIDATGVTPTQFAYPYGEYIPSLASIVAKLGFTGYGQHSGAVGRISDFAALPRFPFGGAFTDLKRLATRLQTQPLPVTARPPGPIILGAAGEPPELQISIPDGPYNLDHLACYASGQGQMHLQVTNQPGVYHLQPRRGLAVGRSKYNCTAPHARVSGVYFWWSYLLMRPHSDGSWYRG